MPALGNEDGGLGYESVGKADLLSDHFDSKQSRDAVDLPLTCHTSPPLNCCSGGQPFAYHSPLAL